MVPSNSRLSLLMIHGVNSTLEWSRTVLSVLEPHFHPRLVRYRYFHTLWGPVKVYVWPTALLYLVSCGILKWSQSKGSGGSTAAFQILLLLLLIQTVITVHAEITWSRAVESKSVWAPPVAFCLIGFAGAFVLSYPWQWIAPIACMTGVGIFLDMREYGEHKFGIAALTGLPIVMMAIAGRAAWALLVQSSLTGVEVAAIAALAEPFLRCRLAFTLVSQEIQKACREHVIQPFVVAHSLGTYLTAHVLHETEWLKLGRILFTGCVLDRRFPLEKLVPQGNERLISLTNHVGRIDVVPVCTGGLRSTWCFLTLPGRIFPRALMDFIRHVTGWRPLGSAGALGFKNRSDVVHTMSPIEPCPACAGGRALIHNVDHGWAKHSTLNNDREFQEWYWVPCLWGIEVHQFEKWLDTCRKGGYHSQIAKPGSGQNVVSARQYEQRLLDGPWSWPSSPELEPSPGRSLNEFVTEYLGAIQSTVPAVRLMRRIPKFLFDMVVAAVAESKKKDNIDPEKIGWLHPQIAVQCAVLLAVEAEKVKPARRAG